MSLIEWLLLQFDPTILDIKDSMIEDDLKLTIALKEIGIAANVKAVAGLSGMHESVAILHRLARFLVNSRLMYGTFILLCLGMLWERRGSQL